MDVSEAQEAKQLRDENTRLRKLVADSQSGQGSAAVGDPKKRLELVAQTTRDDNSKVKGGGQECPPYTGLLSDPWVHRRVE